MINEGIDIVIGDERIPGEKTRDSYIALLDSFNEEFSGTEFIYRPETKEKIFKGLRRARKEFDSSRFFVLIVGPLKSGKSSFVNILTRANVSPTDVLECTAIPTIIGQADGAHLNQIISYHIKEQILKDDDESEVSKQIFNLLIDVLRGLEPASVLDKYIDKKFFDATPENINDIVMVNDNTSEPKPILATIGVPGNPETIIGNQVTIIDMPGLDGKDVNDKKPLYKSMIERADFIFFVQSTTSAINEATNEFLTWLLQNKLTDVPLRLIHNHHDSLHFVKDEITDKMIQRKVDDGVKCIKSKFNVSRNFEHHVFNFAKIGKYLTKAEDIKEHKLDGIQIDAENYLAWEKDIIRMLKAERQTIKDRNSITKCEEYIDKSISSLQDLDHDIDGRINSLKELSAKISRYFDDISNREVSFEELERKVDENILNFRINEAYSNEITKIVNGAAIGSGKISGKDLKGKISAYASMFSEFPFLGENTKMWSFLKKDIQELMTETFSRMAGEMTARLSEVLNEKVEEIEIRINDALLPVTLGVFDPVFSDIEEKTWLVVDRKYKSEEAKEYIRWYGQYCMEVLLPGMIASYVTDAKHSFEQIRLDLTNRIIKRLDIPVNKAVKAISSEIRQLDNQKSVIKGMIGKLSI